MGVIQDKSTIYNQFDILAVPSRNEAFGLVAAEAGASCLPVVASPLAGFNTLLRMAKQGYWWNLKTLDNLLTRLSALLLILRFGTPWGSRDVSGSKVNSVPLGWRRFFASSNCSNASSC